VSRKPKTVVLYGQFHGYWSNAGVSRGLAAGLHANGVSLRLVDEQDLFEGVFNLPRRQGRPASFEQGVAASAPGGPGLFVGYSIRSIHRLNLHRPRIGAFIAESATLPADWGIAAGMCQLVVCPSRWTARAYSAPDRLEPMVVKHGLHPVYARPLALAKPNGLAFLHVAGARDFLDRKGTPQLIAAFARAFDPANGPLRDSKALLVIRAPESPVIHAAIQKTGMPHLFHYDAHEAAFEPGAMRAYYDKGWAAVIQPSRAEAYGLVPLEARACGIPVILTNAHGHFEHVESSDVLINAGAPGQIAVNGIPNGTAPVVSVSAILDALVLFVTNIGIVTERAQATAQGYYEKYQWGKLCEPLAQRLRELQ